MLCAMKMLALLFPLSFASRYALAEAREKARMDMDSWLDSWLDDARYEGEERGRREGWREDATAGKALSQIKEKKYADKYRALNQPIHLIGVEFSKKERNVVGFEVEYLALVAG
ncbi:hypothetical protein FACS189475_08130 [Betaproteobacteria bacterium]|nr:hypothetical protein FACS189475_08130 [Betaproteobacteria bacterium]